MDARRLAFLIALFAVPVAAQQAPPPQPPAELAAMSGVPVIDIRVTDLTGMPIQPATIRWRGPAPSAGTAQTGRNGQFALDPGLQWSAAAGWRFMRTGAHRFEISADGFKTAIFESVDLKPGTTARLAVTLQPLPPRRVLAPEVYKQKVIELTSKTSPAQKSAGFEVRVVGEPVVMPEAARKSADADMPDAIALVAVYEKGRFRDVGWVRFSGDTADSRRANGDNRFEQLDEKEWQEMTSILDGFFAEAVDVTRGPERFVPYLPENMRRMLDLRGEKNRMWLRPEAVQSLSNDQLRRFVSLAFDQGVLMTWIALSGLPSPPPAGGPEEIRRDPVAAIASLESSTAAMRRVLTEGGVITPERMAAAQMYVRRLLGEGYIVRENPERDGIRGLPRGARMYTVMLGAPLPHVIVDKGTLRIVAVDFF